MDFKPFVHAIPYIAICVVFFTSFCGAVEIITAVVSHSQEWLRAKRAINTEVPALNAAVKELRDRQTRVERELQQLRRD
jgi:hypothetical protein